MTSRRRARNGPTGCRVGPLSRRTDRSDSLNPLDLLTLPRSDFDSDAEMLASLLAVGHRILQREPVLEYHGQWS